jgi:hypothetical protein
LHTNSTQNTEKGTYITIKKLGSAGRAPSLRVTYTLAFALQFRKKHVKHSVRIVEITLCKNLVHVNYCIARRMFQYVVPSGVFIAPFFIEPINEYKIVNRQRNIETCWGLSGPSFMEPVNEYKGILAIKLITICNVQDLNAKVWEVT